MRTIHSLILGSIALLANASLYAESPAEIYQRRVIPLLQSSAGSSCAECHLQGVKLTDFLTTDPKETFAALRARGWIDTNHPTESKILQFIAKKPETSTELMNQVRKAEVEAITAWIQATVADPDSLNTPLPKLDDLKLDEKLIQHARKDHVVSRFVDVIWSQFERCANCHSPDRNSKQVEKHGEQMSWIIPNSPAETLQLLEERKLIDLEHPGESILRTKALGLEDHGGGIKFPKDGQTDREWHKFLTDYAAIKSARYTSSTEIPSFASIRTWRNGLHLRIKDLPNFAAGQYAVIRMRRILPDGNVAEEAVAIGEGRASKEGTSWSTTIMLLEPPQLRQTEQAVPWATLMPDGRYQLEWIVIDDSSQPIEKILALPAMKIAVIDSLWKVGHGNAKTISYIEFE
jgi:mono/diheme cytochrome c family protein